MGRITRRLTVQGSVIGWEERRRSQGGGAAGFLTWVTGLLCCHQLRQGMQDELQIGEEGGQLRFGIVKRHA